MLIAIFKRDHSQIEAIIRESVERNGASVTKLTLYGMPTEGNLVLRADVTLKTRQGDEASVILEHEQICWLLNDTLMDAGYERLAKPHLFEGTEDPELGDGARSNIVCSIHYDLHITE